MTIVAMVVGGTGTNVIGYDMIVNRMAVITVSVSISASVVAEGVMP